MTVRKRQTGAGRRLLAIAISLSVVFLALLPGQVTVAQEADCSAWAAETLEIMAPAAPGGGHYSWYFDPTFNLYASTFPNTPLCYTELGYLSGDGYGAIPANFSWARDTSVSEHAQWLGRAVQKLRQSGRVRLAIIFNVDFTHWSDDPQAGYAILRPDGSCPACGPLANAVR